VTDSVHNLLARLEFETNPSTSSDGLGFCTNHCTIQHIQSLARYIHTQHNLLYGQFTSHE